MLERSMLSEEVVVKFLSKVYRQNLPRFGSAFDSFALFLHCSWGSVLQRHGKTAGILKG